MPHTPAVSALHRVSQSISDFDEHPSPVRTGVLALCLLAGLIGATHFGGLPNIPRRDEVSFLRERMLMHSAQEWVEHCLSFNRTRHTGKGDYYLFRPGLFGTHALLDVGFRYNAYIVGAASLLMLLAASFATYLALAKLVPRSVALLLAGLFAVQYAGLEIVLWRHISPYLVALGCLSLAVRLACGLSELPTRAGVHWRTALGMAACVLTGALFHEMAAATGLVAAGWTLTLIFWGWIRDRNAMHARLRGDLWTVAIGTLSGSLAYLLADIMDYWLHQTPGVLGPADHLPASTALGGRIFAILVWIGSAVYGLAIPFGVKLRQDWSQGGLYGWTFNPASRPLAVVGLLTVMAALGGIAYFSRRGNRMSETPQGRRLRLAGILLLSYAVMLFVSLGIGRVVLRDLSYMQNATYYFAFTSWLICAALGVVFAIARQQTPEGGSQQFWSRVSIFCAVLVAMNFVQTLRMNLRERGIRYEFAAKQTSIGQALNRGGLHLVGLKPGSELKFGDLATQTLLTRSPHPARSAPAYLSHEQGHDCLSELLRLPATQRREQVELDLRGTRFREQQGWYLAPVSGNLLRHGEAFLIGKSSFPVGTASVRVRGLWHGGLVVGYRDPDNFVRFGCDFGWAFSQEMIDGKLSPHLGGTTLMQPLPEEYVLRTVLLEDRLCLCADDRILTSLRPTRPVHGSVGIWVDQQYAPTQFCDLMVNFDRAESASWKTTVIAE